MESPPPLQGEATMAEFKSWKQGFGDYTDLINFPTYEHKKQLGILRSALSPEMKQILKYNLDVEDDTSLKVEEILSKIEEHIRKSKNIFLSWYELYNRKQMEGEKFSDFLADLKSLRENADPCTTCKDHTLITLIICGLRDESVRQKLLSSSDDLTLEKVTNIVQANEAAKRDNNVCTQNPQGQ